MASEPVAGRTACSRTTPETERAVSETAPARAKATETGTRPMSTAHPWTGRMESEAPPGNAAETELTPGPVRATAKATVPPSSRVASEATTEKGNEPVPPAGTNSVLVEPIEPTEPPARPVAMATSSSLPLRQAAWTRRTPAGVATKPCEEVVGGTDDDGGETVDDTDGGGEDNDVVDVVVALTGGGGEETPCPPVPLRPLAPLVSPPISATDTG